MGTVPLAALSSLDGVMGEDRRLGYGVHGGKLYSPDAWEEFKQDIATNGMQQPVFVTVEPNGEPQISEGNHRVAVAEELGLDTVPVEIRYFGHSEDQGTLMDRYLAPTRSRNLEYRGYNPDQPRVPAGDPAGGEFAGDNTKTPALKPAAHDFLQNAVNKFYAAGGTVKIEGTKPNARTGRKTPSPGLIRARRSYDEVRNGIQPTLDDAYAGGEASNTLNGEELDRLAEGVDFTLTALCLPSGNRVAIAYDADGRVAGAMSFEFNPDSDSVHIGFLGSMGTVPGVGGALQTAVAQMAADNNQDIVSESTPAALSYHEAMGRNVDVNSGYISSWTIDQVREVASIKPNT
jgi:hypothetical protein